MCSPTADILKMNKTETFKFIELYKSERLLWDPTNEGYRCRESRTAAAKRIADAMQMDNFTEVHAIQKFKNLRSAYCQELKKVALSSEMVTSPEDIYVPKVVWFNSMDSFLRPYIHTRPRRTESIFEEHLDDTLDNTQEYQDNILREAVVKEETEVCDSNYSPQQKRAKRNNNRSENHLNLSSFLLRSQGKTEEGSDDSFDHFGRYIASTLRNMPRTIALRAQGGMMTLLIESLIEIETNK